MRTDQCECIRKEGKWSEPTFRFKTKMYTHTYHKCQLHLSSSSAVETNREYLIRKKKKKEKLKKKTHE